MPDQDFSNAQKLPPYIFGQINTLKHEARLRGEDIIDFGMGNPRSGLGTGSFTKMVNAWCSDNTKLSLTRLKNNKEVDVNFCDNQPVSKHYAIGKKLGVTGTPAIFSTEGILIPGYLSPEDLLTKLKS